MEFINIIIYINRRNEFQIRTAEKSANESRTKLYEVVRMNSLCSDWFSYPIDN